MSTLSAAMSWSLSGVEGFTSVEDQEQLQRIEKQVRRRFVVGSQVSEHAIVQDLIKQVSYIYIYIFDLLVHFCK